MKLDPKKTAMLTLDFQNGILGMVAGAEITVPHAAKAAAFAREKKIKLVHVGLGFSEGHPEIPAANPLFKRIKENNLFVKGSLSAEFPPFRQTPGRLNDL